MLVSDIQCCGDLAQIIRITMKRLRQRMVKVFDNTVVGRALGSLGRGMGKNILVGKFDFQNVQHLDKFILKQTCLLAPPSGAQYIWLLRYCKIVVYHKFKKIKLFILLPDLMV